MLWAEGDLAGELAGDLAEGESGDWCSIPAPRVARWEAARAPAGALVGAAGDLRCSGFRVFDPPAKYRLVLPCPALDL